MVTSAAEERDRLRARQVQALARQRAFVQRVRDFQRAVRSFEQSRAQARARHAGRLSPASIGSSASGAVLTPRQFEIAGLIARGYTNQHIAQVLVLTPGTVANHIQHILERLELRSRTQVAVWYSTRAEPPAAP